MSKRINRMSSVNRRLYDAAADGSVRDIETCIRDGADVNWKNPDNMFVSIWLWNSNLADTLHAHSIIPSKCTIPCSIVRVKHADLLCWSQEMIMKKKKKEMIMEKKEWLWKMVPFLNWFTFYSRAFLKILAILTWDGSIDDWNVPHAH